MDLIFANENFQLRGINYSGFPIILDQHMNVVPELLDFLVKECIKRGRVASVRSWEAYGQSMYDYFSYLETNSMIWSDLRSDRDDTILAAYRNWSLGQLGLKPNTINYRLRIIIRFYQHAVTKGWIVSLPYDLEEVVVRRPKGFLAHTDTSGGRRVSPDVMLKTQPTEIRVLNKEQVREFLQALMNPTHKLLARLALGTGLRREELATIPKKYVVDPVHFSMQSHFTVELNPQEMTTKGNKPRKIHVPARLMTDLWQYILHERYQLEQKSGQIQSVLFLNRFGEPFKDGAKSLLNQWKRLGLSFKVYPHILRHTFATHTLYDLRSKPGLKIDPLMYVRDRLGHSSITTTEKYLHVLADIEDDLMTGYQEELDALSL